MEKTKTSPSKILTQIEYYLSDKNLKRDQFFHKLITQNSEGYLPFANIQKCNNIKKMAISNEDIITAIKESTEVEVSTDLLGVRRTGKKELPSLIVKKIKIEERSIVKKKKILAKVNWPEDYKPKIFTLKKELEFPKLRWGDIQTEFAKQYNVRVFYCRMSKREGNLIINESDYTEKFKEVLKTTPFKMGEEVVELIEIVGEELKEFFGKHGNHYQTCL